MRDFFFWIIAQLIHTSFLRNVRVLFVLANMSDPQPLDAGIIKNVKHLYTKCIVRRYLAQKDPGKPTLLDAMHYLNASWESLTRKTVNNCFRTSRHSPEVEEREPCASADHDPRMT